MVKIDQKRILDLAKTIAAGPHLHGLESYIVQLVRESVDIGSPDSLLRIKPEDTIVYEMSLRYGRADIVVYHASGEVTVIEVKDGSKGYTHVVSGIGQASLYASQIAMAPTQAKKVRKILLWTSVGTVEGDCAIFDACHDAWCIPAPWPSMQILMATRLATEKLYKEASHGSSKEG